MIYHTLLPDIMAGPLENFMSNVRCIRVVSLSASAPLRFASQYTRPSSVFSHSVDGSAGTHGDSVNSG